MRDRIDRGSPVPLYEQIAGAIRWMVATGDIRRGTALAATRDAAERWGVNRHTVRQAYQRLVQWGIADVQPPHRFVIATDVKPAEKGEANADHSRFLTEILRHAEDRFQLDTAQLIASLQRHAQGAKGRETTITVVECNTTQVEDHGKQIAERWSVHTIPFLLGQSDELPMGPVICTVFHFEDLRAQWPERLRDTRFIAVRPNASILREVADYLPAAGARGEIVVVGDETREEARNLSADLLDLFPQQRFEHHLAVRDHWQKRGYEGDRTLTLVGPRAWDSLTDEQQGLPHVFCIPYRIDETDLESLGAHFGIESAPIIADVSSAPV